MVAKPKHVDKLHIENLLKIFQVTPFSITHTSIIYKKETNIKICYINNVSELILEGPSVKTYGVAGQITSIDFMKECFYRNEDFLKEDTISK